MSSVGREQHGERAAWGESSVGREQYGERAVWGESSREPGADLDVACGVVAMRLVQ